MFQCQPVGSVAAAVVELAGRPNASLAGAQSNHNRRSNTQHCDNADINLVSFLFSHTQRTQNS